MKKNYDLVEKCAVQVVVWLPQWGYYFKCSVSKNSNFLLLLSQCDKQTDTSIST